ncbi:PAS domain-containing protein [Halalkalicoccus tibetensis]|uniref:PAS domain-containing protein n=1 Tax=Halalkalicoccus tibetensis TaxID=175632 RepID=A0ABD5V5L0_9EURY
MTRSDHNKSESLTYEEIFHSVEDGILVHDAETGAILDANQAAEHLYGYSSNELTNMHISDFSADHPAYSQEEVSVRLIKHVQVASTNSNGSSNETMELRGLSTSN